jgi:hypothetical protein
MTGPQQSAKKDETGEEQWGKPDELSFARNVQNGATHIAGRG